MIPRRTPIKRRRQKPRRGEPTPAEKLAMREFIYELSGGMCELTFGGKKLARCKRGVLPFEGDVLERWHLVHVRAKRRFGWPTEGPKRMQGGCSFCHGEIHQKGFKPDDAVL